MRNISRSPTTRSTLSNMRSNIILLAYLLTIIKSSVCDERPKEPITKLEFLHNHTHNNSETETSKQTGRSRRVNIPHEGPTEVSSFEVPLPRSPPTSLWLPLPGPPNRNSRPMASLPPATSSANRHQSKSLLGGLNRQSLVHPLRHVGSSQFHPSARPFSTLDDSPEGHPIYVKTEGGLHSQWFRLTGDGAPSATPVNKLLNMTTTQTTKTSDSTPFHPHFLRKLQANMNNINASNSAVHSSQTNRLANVPSPQSLNLKSVAADDARRPSTSSPTPAYLSADGLYGNATATAPSLSLSPPKAKASTLRYLNEIYRLNHTKASLAAGPGTASLDSQLFRQKLNPEPPRSSALGAQQKLSLHSALNNKGYPGILENPVGLGALSNWKTHPSQLIPFPERPTSFPTDNEVSVNRLRQLNPNRQGFPASDPVTFNEPNDLSELASMLGLAPSFTEQVPDSSAGYLDVEKFNLIDLGTTATPPPHMLMEIFEGVFSEEEMAHNPLVRGIHDRLEHHTNRIQSSAEANPYAAALYFFAPLVLLASVAFVALGVSPQFIGLLGLFIPAFVVSTMMNAGVGRAAGGRSNRWGAEEGTRSPVGGVYDSQGHILASLGEYATDGYSS